MNLVKRTDRLPFILEDIINTDWFGGVTNTSSKVGFNIPAVNIIESDIDFELKVAAPGLAKENFNIELDAEILTISSTVDKENAEEKSFARKEFGYNTFKRSFKLPDTVDSKEIGAAYDQGILSIKIPKREEAKVQPKRTIDIS